MCRIVIIASVFFAAFAVCAPMQEKKDDQDKAARKIFDDIRELEKKAHAVRLTGKQSADELVLIFQIQDTKNTFEGLLKFAKKLREDTKDEQIKKVLGNYVQTLEMMERKKRARTDEKDEIKKLIYGLREQCEFAFFVAHDPKSPAAKLLSIGQKSVPYLIDELENDELTRSVSPEVISNNKVISPMYVLRIGDCAYGILKKITKQEFGDSWYIHDANAKMSPRTVREKAKTWWENQKKK